MIAILAICSALVAGGLFYMLPSGWCGTCPRRSLTVGPYDFRFGFVEWYQLPEQPANTWICIGPTHVTIPLSGTLTVGFSAGTFAFLGGVGYRRFRRTKDRDFLPLDGSS